MDNSDIISFHSYEDADHIQQAVNNLQAYAGDRPVICTEYMARAKNSTFQPHMEIMKKANIISINWGLVSGKRGHFVKYFHSYSIATFLLFWFRCTHAFMRIP